MKFSIICLAASLFAALLMSPLVIAGGLATNKSTENYTQNANSLIAGYQPGTVVVTDSQGNTIASLYTQERTPVNFNDISPNMVKAILSVEDRRFMAHKGVDWQGTIRAFIENFSSGHVKQGASTLTQQYVKNYLLLVDAQTDQDRQAATEETSSRKIREAQLALTLERALNLAGMHNGLSAQEAQINTKKQILTRYLNLVYFGHEIYGIQRASQFYFGHPARDLTIAQAAMLAGMLQGTAQYDPYAHPDAMLERRNTVLDTLIANFPESRADFEAAKQLPLGVMRNPTHMNNQCFGAKSNGYFCDYVIQFLNKHGVTMDDLERRSIRIRTTLDSALQRRAVTQVQSIANPHLDSIAEVINLIRPGAHSHDILAMVSSRNYGLDQQKNQTQLPEPDSLVGDGAGSVFKIFTVAAAMTQGMGTRANLYVPAKLAIKNMGFSKTPGCPANTYCVKNDGKYRTLMPVTDALATSPNTAFVRLLRDVGVSKAVDMAVKLGLRSYAEPGTSPDGKRSIADFIKDQNLGSFTLGPVAINDLELSNVAATLASHGVWCPPNPILSLEEPEHDDYGSYKMDVMGNLIYHPIEFTKPACEQVVSPGLADALSNALGKDSKGYGTSALSASRAGWTLPVSAKTGTTETHRSSAFLGYTKYYAGAVYVFADIHPQSICTTPLRSCYEGNVYGGREPAYTWYSIMAPIASRWGKIELPPNPLRYVNGSPKGEIPSIKGKNQDQMISTLTKAGFRYEINAVKSFSPKGTVISTNPTGYTVPGGIIEIVVSNGIPPQVPQPKPSAGILDPTNPQPFTPPDDQPAATDDSNNSSNTSSTSNTSHPPHRRNHR